MQITSFSQKQRSVAHVQKHKKDFTWGKLCRSLIKVWLPSIRFCICWGSTLSFFPFNWSLCWWERERAHNKYFVHTRTHKRGRGSHLSIRLLRKTISSLLKTFYQCLPKQNVNCQFLRKNKTMSPTQHNTKTHTKKHFPFNITNLFYFCSCNMQYARTKKMAILFHFLFKN